MKVTKLDKKTIALIAKATSLMIGRSSALPILESIAIDNGNLVFTDLNHTLTLKNIGIEGSFLFNSSELNKALKLMPEFSIETVLDETGEKQIGVRLVSPDGTEKLKYSVEPFDDFPKTGDEEAVWTLLGELSGKDADSVEIASKFVSKDELRPVMNRVAFRKGFVAGTDAHTLYFETADFQPAFDVLLPPKACRIVDMFHDHDDLLQVSEWLAPLDKREDDAKALRKKDWDERGHTQEMQDRWEHDRAEGRIKIENEAMSFTFRKMDQCFVSFEDVIPQDNPLGLIIAKDALIGPLTKAISQTNQTTYLVAFKLTPERLTISSEDVDYGREYSKTFDPGFTEIQLKDFEEFAIGFDGKKLEKVLSVCGDVIKLQMSAPNRATIINRVLLLMPVMLEK